VIDSSSARVVSSASSSNIRQRELRTGAGESSRHAEPDAARTAGDESRSTFDSIHVYLPRNEPWHEVAYRARAFEERLGISRVELPIALERIDREMT